MSATIPSTMLMSDLLKATGYDCPSKLKGKTFDQSTEGDIPAVLEDNKAVSITENDTVEITPSEGYEGMKKVTASVAIPLEDNKAATIDVSSYSAPVEIVPTSGNTAMKKATIALSNISSGGGSFEPFAFDYTGGDPQSYMFITPKATLEGVYNHGHIYSQYDCLYHDGSYDEYLSIDRMPVTGTSSDDKVTAFSFDNTGSHSVGNYDSIYIPYPIAPNDNPAQLSLYEWGGGNNMDLTQDSTPAAGKTYYSEIQYEDIDFAILIGNDYYTINQDGTITQVQVENN